MFSDMRWARIRAALSTALAAARGTMIWIVRLGYADCAVAVENPAASAAARRTRRAIRHVDDMIPPYAEAAARQHTFAHRPIARLSQSFDAQIIRQLIEAAQQWCRNRDAVAIVFDALGLALLSGQPDPVDVRHAPALAEIIDQHVDPALECSQVAESGDVDGNDGLPGVGGARVVMVEVDHLLAHRRRVQCAGEQANDKREPVPLVAADRQQKTFVRAPRVGERPS